MIENTRERQSKSSHRSALVSRISLGLLAVLMCTGSALAEKNVNPGGRLMAVWKTSPTATTSVPVTFSFHREEQGAGRIALQLGPDGPRFAGTYLRLNGSRSPARIRVFHTYWVSDDFDNFRSGPGGATLNRKQITIEQFQQRYTGSVVATLIGSGNGGMRCVFELLDPMGGLADGATGRCQIDDGGGVELVRPVRR